MEAYKFIFEGKDYELTGENCLYLLNDEDKPVTGLEITHILELLNQQAEVLFEKVYYDQPCQSCLAGKKEKVKYFDFLEYRFFVFTKKGNYVVSSISKDYEDTTFNKLLKRGSVDNSYIASIIVCASCGEYAIEVEQCDI